MNVNELPQYKCHKVVRAGKILATARNPNEDAVFLDVDGVVNKWLSAPAGWLNKHNPDIGGYLVAYEDGYLSYSPAVAFEDGYRLLEPTEPLTGDGTEPAKVAGTIDPHFAPTGLDFSMALNWLKTGKRVQRAGWNGSNQWVELVKNSGLVFRSEHDNTAFSVADGLVLKNAQGIVVQWVPSISDLMADDWKVVGKNVDEPSYRTVSSDGRETLNFVSNTLPHQRRVIEEYDQLFNRHQDLTKFFDTDLYRSLSVEERNRLKEQSLFMAEYQRVLLERIRAF